MSYTKYTEWEPYPSTATLVTAAALNHIENGIKENTDIDPSTTNPLTRTTDGLKVKISSASNNALQVKSDGMYVSNSGGGGGGSTVVVTPLIATGTQIATIEVDGDITTLYAPKGGGGEGGDASIYTDDGIYLSPTVPATPDVPTLNHSIVMGDTNIVNTDSTTIQRSLILGSGNTVEGGNCVITNGTANNVGSSSNHALVSGAGNRVGSVFYSSVIGQGNQVGLGDTSCSSSTILGNGNQVSGTTHLVSGESNNVTTAYNVALGTNLKTSSGHTIRLGMYNEDDTNDMLQIGNGTSESNRKTIFSVTRDGDIHFCKADGTLVSLRQLLTDAGIL